MLCEPHWFKGTLADLAAVRAAVEPLGDARPALLRKDFLLDEYQLWEARLHGADTVLLIVAILDDAQLTALMAASRALGMEPLVEVANAPEMKRALALNARIIGINNRNLHDFTVDMGNSTTLTAGLGASPHPFPVLLLLRSLPLPALSVRCSGFAQIWRGRRSSLRCRGLRGRSRCRPTARRDYTACWSARRSCGRRTLALRSTGCGPPRPSDVCLHKLGCVFPIASSCLTRQGRRILPRRAKQAAQPHRT